MYAFHLTELGKRPAPKPKENAPAPKKQKIEKPTILPTQTTGAPTFNRWGLSEDQLTGKPQTTQKSAPKLSHQDVREQKIEGCWFCLSNPNTEKHLIVSVGKFMYLGKKKKLPHIHLTKKKKKTSTALAKGSLVNDHCLILPISHVTSWDALSAPALVELEM